jgi:hypothetical protein
MLAVICQGQKPIVSASLLRSTSKHTCAPLRKAGKFNRMVDQSCVSFETDLAVGFVKLIFCSRLVGKLRKLAVPVRVQLLAPHPPLENEARVLFINILIRLFCLDINRKDRRHGTLLRRPKVCLGESWEIESGGPAFARKLSCPCCGSGSLCRAVDGNSPFWPIFN